MTIEIIYLEPEVEAYVGLGTYTFDFESIGAEALEVWAVDATDVRTYIPPSDYTSTFFPVDGAPIYDNGEFVLTVEAPVGTTLLSIERNTPITQTLDLQPYGRFGANPLEFALDKLTMICQEIAARKCDNVEQTPAA